MVVIGFSIVLLLCAYGVWRLALRSPGQRLNWSTVWRVAGIIAALRIAALWAGFATLPDSGRGQISGYFLLMVGLPDIYLVKSTRSQPLLWAGLASLVLAVTSVVWSAALLWLLNRFWRPTLFRGGNEG